jgi:hypothetical protein
MSRYTLDPDEDLTLARPSLEQMSQAAAKQSAPTADNTDFMQQAMKVLGDRRAQQQSQRPQRSMPAASERPDVAGDDWKMLLAMGLNLLGNKGKDLGQIAMSATQQRNQRIDEWRAQNSPEAQLKREMQLAQLRNADGEQGRAEAAEAAQLATQLRADFNAREGVRQFDAQQTTRAAEHADDVHFKGLDVTDRRTKIAQDQAQFDAKFGQDASQFQLKLAEDARQSRAQLGLGYSNLKLHRDEIAAANGRNDADNAALIERARIAAEARKAAQAQRGAAQDPRLMREFNKDTEYEQSLAQLLDSAGQLAPEGKDIPGVGVLDGSFLGRGRDSVGAALGDKTSQKAQRMAGIKARLADLSQRMESGAAGPVSEELRYQIQVGAQPRATEAEFRTALKLAREHVGGRLKSAAAGREGQARGVLRARGLEGWVGDQQPSSSDSNVTAPQASPAVDPSGFEGFSYDDDEEQ